MKRKILVFAEHYLPAVKGGGPIRSIKNIVDSLSDKYDFYIVTTDRDLNDEIPFNVEKDRFIQVDKAMVYYTDINKLSLNKLRKIMISETFDVIKLNSFFNLRLSIYPLLLVRLKLIKPDKLILSPKGQLVPSALKFKSIIKRIYLTLAKMFGLYKDVIWHATAKHEQIAIKNEFKKSNVVLIRELTDIDQDQIFIKAVDKKPKELRLVYLSRIHPMKNLLLALRYLRDIEGVVFFSIYGPIEDDEYWLDCLDKIKSLPSNIMVEYKGVIAHDRVYDVFHHHHIFILPTSGENFGHVIFEALSCGCPVVISNQTPWRDLNALGVGYDIELDDQQAFITTLQYYVDIDQQQYLKLAKSAYDYARVLTNDKSNVLAYQRLYER